MTDLGYLLVRLPIAVLLGAGGLWQLRVGLPRLLFSNPEELWRPTDGTVVRSRLEERDTGEGMVYSPVVEYSWRHNGLVRLGRRIAPLEPIDYSRDAALRVVDRYPSGKAVKVYVDPQNPAEAVLEPGLQRRFALVRCALGAVLCGGALFFVL